MATDYTKKQLAEEIRNITDVLCIKVEQARQMGLMVNVVIQTEHPSGPTFDRVAVFDVSLSVQY